MASQRLRFGRQAVWDLLRRTADRAGTTAWEDFTPPEPVTEQRAWFRVTGGDLKLPVYVTLGRDDNNRPVVTGLLLGLETPEVAVTTAALRSISVPELLEHATRSTGSRAVLESILVGEPVRRAPRYSGTVRPHPGRGGLGDEWFRQVADIYRWAVEHHPERPVQEMVERLPRRPNGQPVAESTVRRWISTARDKGFLGEAIPGKSGEQR